MLFRYATAYWSEMNRLPVTHATTHEGLSIKGSWTVQHQSNHPFSSTAADQAIEQTVNRDSKTSGGLRGITLNRGIQNDKSIVVWCDDMLLL